MGRRTGKDRASALLDYNFSLRIGVFHVLTESCEFFMGYDGLLQLGSLGHLQHVIALGTSVDKR